MIHESQFQEAGVALGLSGTGRPPTRRAKGETRIDKHTRLALFGASINLGQYRATSIA
jgi:hypothetical protein